MAPAGAPVTLTLLCLAPALALGALYAASWRRVLSLRAQAREERQRATELAARLRREAHPLQQLRQAIVQVWLARADQLDAEADALRDALVWRRR